MNKLGDDKKRKPSSKKAKSLAQSEEANQPLHDIPKFDLAEQILAEQRKLSSVKRKGPGKRTETLAPQKAESFIRLAEEPPICSEQEIIFAEIVTRDIEKLLKGNQKNG
jgi:hypothetical protein